MVDDDDMSVTSSVYPTLHSWHAEDRLVRKEPWVVRIGVPRV